MKLGCIIRYPSLESKCYTRHMTTELSGPKLTDALKMQVLALMARGEKYKDIRKILSEQHNITYSNNALSMLRKRNGDVIAEIERTIYASEAAEAERIRSKGLRMLSRKLDQASSDELELSAIDEEFRTTDMTLADYKRKKAGLLELSIKDVVHITDKMYTQTKDGPGASAPAGSAAPTAAEARALEAFHDAIKNGDTITLQQLTVKLNNGATADPQTVSG